MMCWLFSTLLTAAIVSLVTPCHNQNWIISSTEYDIIFNSTNYNGIDGINCVYNCNGMGKRIKMSVFDRTRGLCSCLDTAIVEDVAVTNGVHVIVVDFNRLGIWYMILYAVIC